RERQGHDAALSEPLLARAGDLLDRPRGGPERAPRAPPARHPRRVLRPAAARGAARGAPRGHELRRPPEARAAFVGPRTKGGGTGNDTAASRAPNAHRQLSRYCTSDQIRVTRPRPWRPRFSPSCLRACTRPHLPLTPPPASPSPFPRRPLPLPFAAR